MGALPPNLSREYGQGASGAAGISGLHCGWSASRFNHRAVGGLRASLVVGRRHQVFVTWAYRAPHTWQLASSTVRPEGGESERESRKSAFCYLISDVTGECFCHIPVCYKPVTRCDTHGRGGDYTGAGTPAGSGRTGGHLLGLHTGLALTMWRAFAPGALSPFVPPSSEGGHALSLLLGHGKS